MEGNYENVDILCNRFEQCKRSVKKNESVVEMFLQSLKSKNLPFEFNFINNSEFIGIGSSYENTVVNSKADFDIAMVLPSPFDTDHLECLMTEEPGLYLLHCKNSTLLLRQFLNQSNILATENLKRTVFYELRFVLENIQFGDYTIEFETLSSSFCIKLKKSFQYFIKIDIVPQIRAKVNDISDWKSKNLPLVIQNYIASEDTHILFNLSCPPNKKIDLRSCIVQPSLNLLEKVGMLHSDTVRKSVCIAKSVYKHCKWSSKGLRSFHIKRIALHLYNTIHMSGNPWIGYTLILNQLIDMLENGKIDGCFIANQNLICIDTKKCFALAKEVKEIESTVDEDNILDFFMTPVFECTNSFPVIPITTSKQSLKFNISPFMEYSANEWFATLEAQFLSFGIYSNEVKFLYSYPALPHEVSKQIPQYVIAERIFTHLKISVIEFYEYKKWESLESKSPPIFASESQSKNIKESQRIEDNTQIGGNSKTYNSFDTNMCPRRSQEFNSLKEPTERKPQQDLQNFLELENGVETKNSKPMPTPIPTPTPAVQEISILSQNVQMNIPSFMERAAFNWFEMLETKFFLNKITEQLPKFFYAFAALPEEIVIRIPSTIIAERKFSSLKQVVMNLCEVIKTENFSKLISTTTISDKPSLYLQEIKSTAAKLEVADDVVRSKFIEAVSPLIAPVLSSQNELTLSQLGKLADDLMPFLKAVNKQSTPKEEKVDSLDMIGAVICIDHIYFGKKAQTCNTNCQWPNNDPV